MRDRDMPHGRSRSWVWRTVLGVSLALNLLVVGVVAGALWTRGGWSPAPQAVPGQMLGPVPFLAALDQADRAAMRTGWRARGPDLRRLRSERREELQALADALRSDPFDPAALEAVLEDQSRRLAERQALARGLLMERVAEMDAHIADHD